MIDKIYTKNAPDAIGPYSQAICYGNLVFTSGQIAINPSSCKVEAETIESQTEQVCKNISAILETAGSDLNKVIKTVCYLKNINDFAIFNEVYAKYFTQCPARSCMEVAKLPKDVLVEIEVIAYKELN